MEKITTNVTQTQPGLGVYQIADTTGTLTGTTLTVNGTIFSTTSMILNQNTAFTFLVTYG